MILAEINWDVSPIIFDAGVLQLRWYGLLFALGFIVGYQIMQWIFKSEGYKQQDLDKLTIYMVLGTVLGARIGHFLFYNPEIFLTDPLELLMVWHGGLASHGAAIGILLSLWIFVKNRKQITYLWILDRIVIVIALAGCFIRLGNFFNSEIIGLPTDVPWAIVFKQLGEDFGRHPTQLYEAFSYLIIFVVLIFQYYAKKEKIAPGIIFGQFLTLVFGARFFIEFYKENQPGLDKSLTTLNMGQILSIPLVIIGLFFIFRAYRKHP